MKKIIMVTMLLQASCSESKLKCIIFTSEGGGGHRSADKAITSYIEDEFEVELAFLIRDILAPVDPIRFLTFNHYCSEDLYNFCLGKRWYRLTNIIGNFGTWSISWYQSRVERCIENFLLQRKTDFIISVVPLYNGPIVACARKLNIPCLIVPTDLDSQYFVCNLQNNFDYKRWKYILPFEDKDILESLGNLPLDRIIFGGFPIRKSFFNKKDTSMLKREFEIPEDKQVIMLLMGAQGSNGSYDCMKSIIQLKKPLHIIICLGKNDYLAHRIKKLRLPDNITYTLVGFTERIADYMAITDILITKSGTVSVCEALYAGLPMILDQTSVVPIWEQFNHNFIIKHDYGDILTNYKNLNQLLEKYFEEDGYYQKKKDALTTFARANLGSELLSHMHQLMDIA